MRSHYKSKLWNNNNTLTSEPIPVISVSKNSKAGFIHFESKQS